MAQQNSPHLTVETLGETRAGEAVQRFTLRNRNGLEARIMSLGGVLMSLKTPDRQGAMDNIVLGFEALAPYLAGTPYFGAIVGRVANRIAGARFVLDGVAYELTANEGDHHLHGGACGFDQALWRASPFEDEVGPGLRLHHVSPDGDQGYPGELAVDAVYQLTHDNRLTISYAATTTRPTHVNLTHHSYFNLSGRALRPIGDHRLQIYADRFLPVDADLIPAGAPRAVEGAPFDFRAETAIGARIAAADAQLRRAGGYDHCFVLDHAAPGALMLAARLTEPDSGRVMEIRTTEPGLQFYSGNRLEGGLGDTRGGFSARSALCLEPQHFPDAPNRPDFPSTLLRPGQTYRSQSAYAFSVAPG
jgi:aldose 1-epimerase